MIRAFFSYTSFRFPSSYFTNHHSYKYLRMDNVNAR